MTTFQQGDRVRVRESSGVCSYLWGHVGTVERVKPDSQPTFTGPFVVRFDEPLPRAAEYWEPMAICTFEAAHLEPMPSREAVAAIQARSDETERRLVQLGFFGGDR
jgi:hypothetical protein